MVCVLTWRSSSLVQWPETLPNLLQKKTELFLHPEQRCRPCLRGVCRFTNKAEAYRDITNIDYSGVGNS